MIDTHPATITYFFLLKASHCFRITLSLKSIFYFYTASEFSVIALLPRETSSIISTT
jgi:hypothetical protein